MTTDSRSETEFDPVRVKAWKQIISSVPATVTQNSVTYMVGPNVNPEVAHPRWSQATERRIGEDGLFNRKRKTLMFNGYPEVASLYSGMDLKKFF